jgi:DNA-binding PadR family transcriptional regulator
MGTATPLTPLAMSVLELLHERDMHPYEMTQLMRERSVDYRVKMRPGSLYHTVERLEAQGHIEIVDTQRQGRRPERTVYGLTELGRDTFVEQVRAMLANPAQEYLQYTVALSASSELEMADAIEQLKARVLHLRSRLAADQVIIDSLLERRLPRMYWIDYAFVRHVRQSELDWTEQLIEDLESGQITWPVAEHSPSGTKPNLSIVDEGERNSGQAS